MLYDGSPDSAAALRLGALDAARTGSDVHVVVLPPAGPDGGTTAIGLLLDAAQEAVHEAAPAAATVLSVAPGPVLPAVLAAARGARLLAVGARGPGHEWAAGWDETAVALSWRAPVPVLVAHAGSVLLEPGAPGATTVLAALTGGAADAAVVRTATALARRGGGRLQLVHTGAGGGALTRAVARADVVVCRADAGVAVEHLLPVATVHALAVRLARPVLTVPAGAPARPGPRVSPPRRAAPRARDGRPPAASR
ncbi:hypothetical protein [Kineococcus auxinigenes]|uniref:hypothetical protein n=1 Tax=Kineococcus sp. SYSU DK032 TaxID=3383153 RepID=UPI003D7E1CFE